MRKLLLAVGLLFIGAVVHAEVIDRGGPATSTTYVEISSAADSRNCLAWATVEGDAAADFAIIDGALVGGTSIYIAAIVADTPFTQSFGMDEAGGFCVGWQKKLTLNVGGGNFNINYATYRRNR